MIPRSALIFHGYRWPAEADRAAYLAELRSRVPGSLRIIEAREDPSHAIGAAALVNRAAAAAEEDVLVVAEPCVRWPWELLDRIARAAARGLVVVRPHTGDTRSRVWGVSRAAFSRLGGLDERLWSVGEIDDLRARARTLGVPVEDLDGEGPWIGPEPYPLPAHTRAMLERRNRLITAFKTASLDELGETLALAVADALVRSASATGVGGAAFAFGSRERPRVADEAGTLGPLLALDSFCDELPALAEERRALAANGASFVAMPHDDAPARDLVDALLSYLAAAR